MLVEVGRRRPRALTKTAVLALLMTASLALAGCGQSGEGAAQASGPWEPEGDVEWVVPYSPGGGFDTYSRGLAEVMEEEGHLPEGVNIVIRNITPLPQGITSLYSAEPDGQTVGILPMPAATAQQIQTPDVARWETDKFTVLGSVDQNAYVVYVPADSPYQTIDDLIAADDLRSITVEKGSSSALATLAAIDRLGLDAKLTYGAEGSSEVVTAALRGDADFFVYGSTDVVGYIESGDVRPLLFLGTDEQRPGELEWLQDVPSAEEVGHPELAGTVTELRALVAPPGLPNEVAEYWRNAMYETMTSEAFAAWAKKAERPLVPLDHKEAEAAMQDQIKKMQQLVPALTGQS